MGGDSSCELPILKSAQTASENRVERLSGLWSRANFQQEKPMAQSFISECAILKVLHGSWVFLVTHV